MDIFQKAYEYNRADGIIEAGLYPYFRKITQNDGPVVMMNGIETIMIGSNNYLGLSQHPKVIEAAIKATEKYGTTCSGSRYLNGTTDLHIELELKLAKFVGKEKAFVATTGYMTNLAAVSAIASRGDVLIVDKTNHASLVDGQLNAFGAVVKRYEHNDMNDLERVLSSIPESKGKMIVSDGVFSVEGNVVNLPEIVRLAKQYDARIYIDDAHGIGVIGKTGGGTLEHYGLSDDVDIVMSTFSKSFASLGGFIAGEAKVIDFIKHTARPIMFGASMTPSSVAATLAALEIIIEEPSLVKKVNDNADFVRTELNAMGYDTGKSETPIIPIVTYDEMNTLKFAKKLADNGIFTNPFIPPGVPEGRSMIRTSYMATHTKKHLEYVVELFEKLGKEYGIIS
jgi:8-amino-7-oxononanoate synthase